MTRNLETFRLVANTCLLTVDVRLQQKLSALVLLSALIYYSVLSYVLGYGAGTHCQSLLLHAGNHSNVQQSVETHAQRD